ncbi:amino acid transporter [Hortaea werneckii]|nr:amino acid transporter [Hortaea werneckii]KAI7722422.1 amino acid transporter [Hortaea werneckii]
MCSPSNSSPDPEKKAPYDTNTSHGDPENVIGEVREIDDHEVFKEGGNVNFRTVGWSRATVIFLKIVFATGVLSIPVAMSSLGAIGGALSVLGWGMLNTYTARVQGDFRNNHRHCHSIADMAKEVGGWITKEIAGGLFIIAYVLCSGSGIVAVTTRNRPAAAPATGEYDLGFYAVAYPSFAAGMVATCTVFVSSAGTSAFLPVISEMKNPRDFRKALFLCMSLITAAYLAFSLVVYRWCGQWVASPSLGSAGQTVKMVAYGVGLVGLIVSACLYLHVAAKYCFVRVLRRTRHLQENTITHWVTWLGLTFGLGALAFALAMAIPIFQYLIVLTGSICFAPLALSLPGWLWIYDHKSWYKGSALQQAAFCFHAFLIPLGLFILVGGTYGVVEEIIQAYADGTIGSAFSCADNSGST